jgi:hypothetical protein
MRRKILLAAAAALGFCAVLWATTYSTLRNVALVNSTVNSTPIGGAASSTGAFTTVTANNLNYGSTTSVCSTSGNAGSICTSTVTLNSTEPDTNYVASCTGVTPSGYPFIRGIGKGTSSITVAIQNGTSNEAVVSTYAELDCVALGQ